MTSAEVVVTLVGVGVIVCINWYFFAGTAANASQSKHDDQHH
jgi:hypothetical protein